MSKASDWAIAQHRLSMVRQVPAFYCKALKPLRDRDGTRLDECSIHVCVAWRVNGTGSAEPTFNWTDWRLGGVQLAPKDALALAHWIIDHFGDDQRSA